MGGAVDELRRQCYIIAMPISRPTLDQITTRITNDIETELGVSLPSVSVLRVMAKVLAGSVYMLYGYLDNKSKNIFPDSAESTYLERWANIWGLAREDATFAECDLSVAGVDAAVIPAGSQWVGSTETIYESTADATIASGTATVHVKCQSSGSVYNVTSGQYLTLLSPIAGINGTAIVLSTNLTEAADAESDDSLLARVLARIQQAPQGGALADYIAWAREISGVTRAWAYENYMGAGTVGVTFVCDNAAGGPIPGDSVVAAVQAHIDTVRPLCANVTVFKPTSLPINMSITLSPNTTAMQAAVQESLAAYISAYGYPGSTLYLSKLNEAISTTAGVTDQTITLINGATPANVVLTNSQFAQLGAITWSV